jgi:hypothetical protein
VYRRCTVFDTEIRLVNRTWTSFEFSCQEKSHVMGRVPDAFRPSGLIFLLESKKASCIRSVPAFGPNLCVGVEKVGHEVSSTGCEPAFKTLEYFLNFSPHLSCCTTTCTLLRPSLYSFSHHRCGSTPSTSNSSQKNITSPLITFEQSCVLSTARHPTSDDNQHAR